MKAIAVATETSSLKQRSLKQKLNVIQLSLLRVKIKMSEEQLLQKHIFTCIKKTVLLCNKKNTQVPRFIVQIL